MIAVVDWCLAKWITQWSSVMSLGSIRLHRHFGVALFQPDLSALEGKIFGILRIPTYVSVCWCCFWKLKRANNCLTVVDTGSSILFLPKYTTDLANKMISDAYWHNETQKWLIPCKTGRIGYEVRLPKEKKTPIFSFQVNDRVFGVPPRDLVMYPDQPFNASTTGGRKDHCLSRYVVMNEKPLCWNVFFSIQFGTDQFAVLGNTFIKNVAVSFSRNDFNVLLA